MHPVRCLMLGFAVAGSAAAVDSRAAPVSAQASCTATKSGWYYCREGPEQPLLVFLSGLGSAAQDWPPDFLRAVHEFAGTLTYNRRGYPPSPHLDGQPVLASAAAADLHQLLEDLQLERPVVLVAHSLGGLYANFFARRYPGRVRGLVLIDPASPEETPGDPRFKSRGRSQPGSPDDREDAGAEASIVETRSLGPFPDLPLLVLAATNHAAPPDVERAWFEIQQRTAAESPRGRLIVASGAGHYIHTERAEWTAATIKDFLAALKATGHEARGMPDNP